MESSKLRVLIVEDHIDIAANIGEFLEAKLHTVDYAYDGTAGLALARENEYDALVVDVNLPGHNGFGVCAALRHDQLSTPVLMLTARDTLEDKLAGFEAGADDYLTKPFALEELAVRLEAIVRRGRARNTAVLTVEDLSIDVRTGLVERSGVAIELNPMSLTLLIALARQSPAIVARSALEHRLWGQDPPVSDALRSQIYVLRRAIDRPFESPLLHTVHGVGYRLAAPH